MTATLVHMLSPKIPAIVDFSGSPCKSSLYGSYPVQGDLIYLSKDIEEVHFFKNIYIYPCTIAEKLRQSLQKILSQKQDRNCTIHACV
eukprot:m.41222 g.41222  ORF g.41222 m.41222 type:complete len:88 (-) comp6986_c0_seq1:503-766(-)